jgi:putative transcriptional regulator
MTKAGERLIAGMQEAIDYAEGTADPSAYKVHTPTRPDVRKIRNRMALTQAAFAARYGFPLETLRKWEQGTRQPTGAAATLLLIIDRAPAAVEKALAAMTL